MSLRYIMDGVDFAAFGAYIAALKEQTGVNRAADVTASSVYAHCCAGDGVTLTPVFEEAVKNGDLTADDHAYWQVFSMPGRVGSLAFNCPEFFTHTDGTSQSDLTRAQIVGKQAIRRQTAFYKKYFRGFENAYIAEIAPMVGVRESREIAADYIMTAKDLLSHRKFPDGICASDYPVDIHGDELGEENCVQSTADGKKWYDIPYRALIVKGFDNLLVAGRCLGADFLVQSSLRVQHSARATGEAAGIGAACACMKNCPTRDIDGALVRHVMLSKGARFPQ